MEQRYGVVWQRSEDHLTIIVSHVVSLSHAQRLARRAARFGENTSIEAKKLVRAER